MAKGYEQLCNKSFLLTGLCYDVESAKKTETLEQIIFFPRRFMHKVRLTSQQLITGSDRKLHVPEYSGLFNHKFIL